MSCKKSVSVTSLNETGMRVDSQERFRQWFYCRKQSMWEKTQISDYFDSTLVGISCWWDWMVLLRYAFPTPVSWLVYLTICPTSCRVNMTERSQPRRSRSVLLQDNTLIIYAPLRTYWISELKSFSTKSAGLIKYSRPPYKTCLPLTHKPLTLSKHWYMRLTKSGHMRRECQG